MREQLNGSVVGAVMSNFGLEKALNDLGISFIRVPVGDRYIMETLRKGGWNLGGEASGHIICLDRTTTGDGIVAALQVLAAMVTSGRALHELKSGMVKYPQTLLNVRLPANIGAADRLAILDDGAVQDTLQAVESELAGKGRVLLRPSGTEPLLRVMVEGRDSGQVEGMAQRLAKAVSEAVASR
jgi:phosphoglucosamine mutase